MEAEKLNNFVMASQSELAEMRTKCSSIPPSETTAQRCVYLTHYIVM
jgi:hypothetical protein